MCRKLIFIVNHKRAFYRFSTTKMIALVFLSNPNVGVRSMGLLLIFLPSIHLKVVVQLFSYLNGGFLKPVQAFLKEILNFNYSWI